MSGHDKVTQTEKGKGVAFRRIRGKLVPIKVGQGKKATGDKRKLKTGPFKGRSRGEKKKATKSIRATEQFFGRRNKVIKKSQGIGLQVGVAAGLGIAAARGKGGLLKAAVVGGLAGLFGGTVSGVSRANKRLGSAKDFNKRRQQKLKRKNEKTGI